MHNDTILITTTTFSFNARDERRNDPTASAAHEWCAKRGLSIHAPLWGSGSVMTADRKEVDPACLPDFVLRHIEFVFPA